MHCSLPGFPVLHHLPKLAQTHIHWVGDAIQPSGPLLSHSYPAYIFPSIRVFSNESAFHIRWPKYWSSSISSSNEYSSLISFRIDWSDLLAVQFSCSVCPILCDPMDCSTPGFPVHHQPPELTKTHVQQVSDAIQPIHPLSSPFLPAFNFSQHQGLLKWVSSLHQVAKVLEFQLQHQSFQWTLRTDLL